MTDDCNNCGNWDECKIPEYRQRRKSKDYPQCDEWTKILSWDEKLDKNGNIIKFNEDEFVESWWRNLLPRQRADIYRAIHGDDPIQDWKKEVEQMPKLCPKCRNVIGWNSHFQVYYCGKCGTSIDKEGKVEYGKGDVK